MPQAKGARAAEPSVAADEVPAADVQLTPDWLTNDHDLHNKACPLPSDWRVEVEQYLYLHLVHTFALGMHG